MLHLQYAQRKTAHWPIGATEEIKITECFCVSIFFTPLVYFAYDVFCFAAFFVRFLSASEDRSE